MRSACLGAFSGRKTENTVPDRRLRVLVRILTWPPWR